MSSRRRCMALLIGCFPLFAASCSRSSTSEFVVAYVAVDRKDSEPVLDEFTRQTGVEVRAVYDAEFAKTTGLVSRLLAEADRPRCDLFWNNEHVQTMLLADRGLLAKHPHLAENGPQPWQDSEGRWLATASRARVIVYNTRHVSAEHAPRSLFDLANPRWRGKVAIANPQFGTTRTHVAALFAVLGPPEAKKFLQNLLANDVRIVDGNAMVKNLVARADPDASPVFVGLTDTDDVLSGQAEGEPIAMIYPDQDSIGTLLVPSTIALMANSPHPNAARQLFDYLANSTVIERFAAPGSGYTPAAHPSPRADATPQINSFQLSSSQLLQQLEPSTLWTREHFRH